MEGCVLKCNLLILLMVNVIDLVAFVLNLNYFVCFGLELALHLYLQNTLIGSKGDCVRDAWGCMQLQHIYCCRVLRVF